MTQARAPQPGETAGSTSAALRHRAETAASRFPPLLVRAQQLAGSVLLGEHGRRRAGMGDDFWQYRPVQAGDSRRMIDHRRSAKGDQQFVREREWQIAQTVHLWVDQGASMRFASTPALPQKIDRARLLGLAASVMMLRAGERVGLTGGRLPPRRGNAQVLRLADALSLDDDGDYTPPEDRAMLPHARVLFLSDFLGPFAPLEQALAKAADRGVHGVLMQVLDPAEEEFPFDGRTIFESVGGGLRHETLKAGALKQRYLDRLAERRDALDHLCRAAGWRLGTHHTGDSAQAALMWLFHAMERSGS
ncbi:DUF58 domain-containing protein [Phaeobacter gallaeciensis]|uniref:DUF58 domain-containing protein n=1 Tax=Phaeobacter gallaeciensis TaxID=60890 RepID=A0AAC9Z681_9RHOB|nr:DUF58 domain-containing protein [Phaeobacter gallaeciensis]AHD07868.1 Uncharacterized protein Gal_00065 [Phaeobacter gallaeciensis DSM 26640]ATE91136.1 hypothetical protein PhaeoP11_00064 [Phaeobacter gallaeciensis]ATE95411.1 hypothetical protein PhaeoP73_00064 [Phaeobacter gallaeciensis]ATE99750.1 hypothetical protein PhaeoP75_00064 [Phaeobacter gallaeciensis]ATF04183.1 hypothetical protein PhaeoP63_00064 [Phaeobacter gallaeciensis]